MSRGQREPPRPSISCRLALVAQSQREFEEENGQPLAARIVFTLSSRRRISHRARIYRVLASGYRNRFARSEVFAESISVPR